MKNIVSSFATSVALVMSVITAIMAGKAEAGDSELLNIKMTLAPAPTLTTPVAVEALTRAVTATDMALDYDTSHFAHPLYEHSKARSERWNDRIEKVVGAMDGKGKRKQKPLIDIANFALDKVDVTGKDVLRGEERRIFGKPHDFKFGVKVTESFTVYVKNGIALRLADDWMVVFPDFKRGTGISINHVY